MSPTIVPYSPPSARQAAVAAGLSPLLVLLAFTLLVQQLIDADTALAWLLGLTVWVVVELSRYQRALDGYNADYAQRHLAWRTPATLQLMADNPALPASTRDFIAGYLADGCSLLGDGQHG